MPPQIKLYAALAVIGFAVAGGAVGVAASRPGNHSDVASCAVSVAAEAQIPAGIFLMGAGSDPGEGVDIHKVAVRAFSIDRYAVTNADFAAFVAATGYITDAERTPNPEEYPDIPRETLVAGGAVFSPPSTQPDMQDVTDWWSFIPGADWRHPFGPKSNINGMQRYPVVQVSHNDAKAYAHWRGRELPTEEQYEFAARGGLDGEPYAWGHELNPDGKQMANVWQGEFPSLNTNLDGFPGAAPVGCFPANGYGLYDMSGNVWQWTNTVDDAVPDSAPTHMTRIIKGGSFLCSANFCSRYRPATRQSQESGFGSVNLGFRTVSRART